MYRILMTGFTTNYGGVESVVMNWYRHIDRSRFQFDFLVKHGSEKIAFEDEILELGGKVYREYYGRKESPLLSYKKIENIFKDNPEIVGVHMNINSLEYITPLTIAKKRMLPIRIIHSHNSGNINENDRLETRIMQKINRKIVSSPQYRKLGCSAEACEFMFGECEYTILNNAIELERFSFDLYSRNKIRKRYNIDDYTIAVGFIGRLHYQKNPQKCIRVFYEYNKIFPNSVLLIAGQGELETECKKMVKELNISDKVLFLGVLSDTSKLYSALDILLMPSRFEGLGVVLIEAQTSGLPCLISDTIPDSVMITNSIFKHPEHDSDISWGKHMDYIIKNRPKRDNNFSIIAANGYGIDLEIKVLERIYEKALIQNDI